jgi:hypothetical protein
MISETSNEWFEGIFTIEFSLISMYTHAVLNESYFVATYV